MKLKSLRFAAVSALLTTPALFATQVDVLSTLAITDPTLGVKVLSQNQMTWTKDKTYILTDRLFIKNGQTLTIEPGTRIYASTNDNGSPSNKADDKVGSLVAARGGRLIADGTAAEPIVFTSIRELEALTGTDSPYDPDTVAGPMPGPADAGHWGGVILLGNSYVSFVNATGANIGNAQIEGFAPTGTPDNDGDTLPDATEYGFDATFPRDDADDSGVLRYVSIRHGGYEFAAGKEINGLTLGGVGSGTIIDHIEVYANQDDGIEFFGGTVPTKHILMAFNQDDSFDIDEAYTADNQFWFAIQNPGISDAGGEWDGLGGNSSGFATGKDTPRNLSAPRIFNATFVGPGADRTLSKLPSTTGQVAWEKGNYALHIEDYFDGQIHNSAFHDFAQGFVKFNDNAASTGQRAAARNNTIGDYGGLAVTGTNNRQLFFNTDGVTPNNGNEEAADFANGEIQAYHRDANSVLRWINPLPKPGSSLLTSDITPGAPEPAPFRGAFGATNWAGGWTRFSEAGFIAATYSVTPSSTGGTPPFADIDGDGISDTLESTPEMQALGFSVGTNDAARFASLYTASSIQDLTTTGQVMVQVQNGQVSLTLPVEKSNSLGTWSPAGNMSLSLPQEGDKQFYRLKVESAK